ncbi:hypothetical protein LSTR_LSTR017634 [Laodelphax striatellus]|uniref:Uncharacterized protein n=1 Tax=Laodelphax striatellus TaxID=195883 RepID=A0A482WRT0_LAOST|nr:hypothetical protein LSTR_LSTR012038 [Laodelphax striatellus]RZF42803.1 hypothetical protein LSTR_LSTR017634 [Laodelphax striatellus]
MRGAVDALDQVLICTPGKDKIGRSRVRRNKAPAGSRVRGSCCGCRFDMRPRNHTPLLANQTEPVQLKRGRRCGQHTHPTTT